MNIELIKKILVTNRSIIGNIQFVERDICLEDNLNYVFAQKPIETWNGECLPTAEDYERLRNVENLLVAIPWGRNNGRRVERVIRQLEIQNCKVKGLVITEADDRFVKAYYAIGRRSKE